MVDEIVGPGRREVLLRVVDDLVRSERLHQFQIRGAADRGDFGPEGLRQLDRRGAQGPGGSVDEDLLSRADASSAKEIQRTSGSPRDGGGFLEGRVGRFEGARTLLCQASVLGVRPGAEPEDLVPRFESAYILSDRFDFSGKVRPEDGLPRFQEAEEEPNEKWIRLPQTDVPRGHGRRTDPDQDLIILRGRLFHFLGLEDGRRSVFRADNRFHWIPSSPPRHTAKFSSRLTDRRGS